MNNKFISKERSPWLKEATWRNKWRFLNKIKFIAAVKYYRFKRKQRRLIIELFEMTKDD